MSVTPSETEDRLTSDVTPHYATLLHGDDPARAVADEWTVSCLPGRTFNRWAATSALLLAELVANGATSRHVLVQTFARELSMDPAEAVRLAAPQDDEMPGTDLTRVGPHDGHAVGDEAAADAEMLDATVPAKHPRNAGRGQG